MTPNETDDGVLDPEDLVLDDEHVARIDRNRYVVSPERTGGGTRTAPDLPATDPARPSGESPAGDGAITGAVSPADVLANVPEPHGVDVTLKTDGEVARFATTSHDVREVFADLLTWYAGQLDDDLSPSDALDVLLATTDLD